jgi:release factor glutamine methyltransferase
MEKGVDISESALEIAKQNSKELDLSRRVTFLRSNWLQNVEGSFDLIVSNPPYIAASSRASLPISVAK